MQSCRKSASLLVVDERTDEFFGHQNISPCSSGRLIGKLRVPPKSIVTLVKAPVEEVVMSTTKKKKPKQKRYSGLFERKSKGG